MSKGTHYIEQITPWKPTLYSLTSVGCKALGYEIARARKSEAVKTVEKVQNEVVTTLAQTETETPTKPSLTRKEVRGLCATTTGLMEYWGVAAKENRWWFQGEAKLDGGWKLRSECLEVFLD